MPQNKMLVGAATFAALMLLYACVFTVNQTEKALKLRLGKVVSSDYTPGLHFKMPIINSIRKFDARIQTLDASAEQYLTAEKKNLIVDSFVKWRIHDVITYFTATGGDERRAGNRLRELIADGLRSEFGKRTIQEVVAGERADIMRNITEEAGKRAVQFGIKILDVRIKRIELPKEVSGSVFSRMEAERERVARELRSRGEATAVRIRAQSDRESIELIAKAERDAERIRGEGDGIASEIYASAYTKNPEFYALYRSLNAYKSTFSNKDDILLLSPDSDFFRYFNAPYGTPASDAVLSASKTDPDDSTLVPQVIPQITSPAAEPSTTSASPAISTQ